MSKIVCVKCEVELYPECNDTVVIETAKCLDNKPYKLWFADIWKCPKCGMEVVCGFGNGPIAEHYQEGFEERMKQICGDSRRVVFDHEQGG